MHINIWINKDLIKGIETIMKVENKKRNTVIADAVAEYIKQKELNSWPQEIKNFDGIQGINEWRGFEKSRNEFKQTTKCIFE